MTGGQRIAGIGVDHRQRGQQAFGGNEAVPGLLGQLLGLVQDAHKAGVDIDLPLPARDLGLLGHRLIGGLTHGGRVAPRTRNQVAGKALFVIHQRLQQMLGHHALVFLADRDGLRRLHEATRPFGKLFHIH